MLISNGRVTMVVFNEKSNNAKVSIPAKEQEVINSHFYS